MLRVAVVTTMIRGQRVLSVGVIKVIDSYHKTNT